MQVLKQLDVRFMVRSILVLYTLSGLWSYTKKVASVHKTTMQI